MAFVPSAWGTRVFE